MGRDPSSSSEPRGPFALRLPWTTAGAAGWAATGAETLLIAASDGMLRPVELAGAARAPLSPADAPRRPRAGDARAAPGCVVSGVGGASLGVWSLAVWGGLAGAGPSAGEREALAPTEAMLLLG
mmetsp:Transcript_8650/g.34136  ORF Transcript_8650/g.34136 Transcript_8650/m.34136 type:complete len:124 (-) Transcript_8650:192-563(-)